MHHHHTLTGNFRYHPQFHSRYLKPDRDLIVYLPPNYHTEPERRFPVCYMHDGQNLFDAATAFAGREWGLDEAAEGLIREGQIEPLILVGIYNAGPKRITEYTHVKSGKGEGGRARAYGKMIFKDLVPFIDGEYRTLTGPVNTAMGGSSLGGLVTMFLGLQYPDIFGKLIVMSPSVWWAHRDILKQVAKIRHKHEQKIWLDIGTNEGSHPEHITKDVEDLRDALLSKGWRLGEDLVFVADQDAGHDEGAWGNRVPNALRFLFPAPQNAPA